VRLNRWTTVVVIGLFAALLAWATWERIARTAYVNALEADYQLVFYNLVSRVEEAETALAKAMVSASPRQQVFYFAQVWNQASDAQDSLSQLPLENLNLSATRKFLAQLGDYSLSLARKIAGGGSLTPDDRHNLARLQESLADFSQRLHALTLEDLRWTRLAGSPGGTPRVTTGRTRVSPAAPPRIAELAHFERAIQQMPVLTYDGPFSDHLLRVAPKGLTGPTVSQAKAQAKAVSFAQRAGVRKPAPSAVRRIRAPFPGYSFTLASPQGRIYVDVTEKGGHVVQMLYDRPVGAARLGVEEAVAKATEFLERQGFRAMVPTYSLREGNTCTVSAVAQENGVLIYPDQIKVKIALDNGEVLGWDATAYYTNHRKRTIPRPLLAEASARTRVNENLTVGRGRLCLIPSSGGRERLAWEFDGRIRGDRFLVYINALTGAEEQILKVVEQKGGQLVM
jgi:germination protein YpeB